MNKISYLLKYFRAYGFKGCFRILQKLFFCRTTTLLMEKVYSSSNSNTEVINSDCTLTLQEASEKDIEDIVRVWPEEFSDVAEGYERVRSMLEYRFSEGVPCFVAHIGDKVVGAVWCDFWKYDSALAKKYQGRKSYEIRNVFTVDEVRGQGVASKLMSYAIRQMSLRGKPVAYSRILPPRAISVRLHEKLGFKQLGILETGFCFGKRYCFVHKEEKCKITV